MVAIKRKDGSAAVIGAGLAGLSAAGRLARQGVPVTLFDKGRGPGGRMSTRRVSDYRFDHGAQHFSAGDKRFTRVVAQWARAGVVRLWDIPIAVLENGRVVGSADSVQRYVGTPDMDAVIASLASACEVNFATRVSALQRKNGQWSVVADGGGELGRYDIVLVAVPPAQALEIIGPDVNLTEPLSSISMLPCWAVMAAFKRAIDVPFDAAFVGSSPLCWVARNGSKPERPASECWVLHASPDWSRAQLELTPDNICKDLLDAFSRATGKAIPQPVFATAHRWRYAKVEEPLGVDSLWDPELKLGICGDWCLGARVEAAFLSGLSLAGRVLKGTASLPPPPNR